MIPRRVCAFFAVTLLLGADGAKKDETEKDVQRLQGTWTLISLENNGEVMPPETLKGRKLIVNGDDSVFMQAGEIYSRSKQKLDSSKNPKQIDITQTDGKEKGKITKGIYFLDGDNLSVCYVYPGESRATDFKAAKDSGCILLKYQRDPKPEDAVRQVLDAQVAAWNKGDLEEFMKGYWNSEKLTFFSGGDKTFGWKATLKRYQAKYKSEGKEMGKLAFSELEIDILGPDSAMVRGRWQLELSKEKPGGLFTLIFKKTSDGWRIIHDHTSIAITKGDKPDYE